MALSPEKNDVDISKLFAYRREIDLKGVDNQEKTVYMRVIGDADLQRARVKALRASRVLRKELRDETSDMHLAFVPDFSEATKERIIEMQLIADLKDISVDVSKELDIPLPTEIEEDATLEEQEEYQQEIDDFPDKRMAIVKEEVLKRAAKMKEEYMERDLEDLRQQYKARYLNQLCEQELTREFYDYTTFYSLYSDNTYKTKLFDNFEDYKNLPADIKELLTNEYGFLELGIEQLKK